MAHPPDKKRRLEKRERKRRQSLDGDGSWRRTSGERRTHERRRGERDDEPNINQPTLDDLWDSLDDTPKEDSSSKEDISEKDNADQGNVEENNLDVNDTTDTESSKPKILTVEEQARLASLKNMLNASNARYKQASKKRRPAFAAGLEIKVTQGEHMGKKGVVLDADYIDNRALISLPDQESPCWLDFRILGHAD